MRNLFIGDGMISNLWRNLFILLAGIILGVAYLEKAIAADPPDPSFLAIECPTNPSLTYTPEDLQLSPESQEARQITAACPSIRDILELKALAEELEYSPVKIYNWVYDNIEFYGIGVEPYYTGLRLGAFATYLTKQGNDWDTTALLVTLLRISGVPTRYVEVDDGNGSVLVYAEASVRMDNYRNGKRQTAGGENAWIQLAPWLKELAVVQQGINLFPEANTIPEGLNFDFKRYLGVGDPPDPNYKVNPKTAIEEYEVKVRDYLARNQNLYPGKSLKDIPFKIAVVSSTSTVLPASLPQRLTANGTRAYHTQVPETNKVKIGLFIEDQSEPARRLLAKTVYLAEVATKSFALDFKEEAGGYLRPVLTLDGELFHSGTDLAGKDNKFVLKYDLSGEDCSQQCTARPPLGIGTFIQISLDPLSASPEIVRQNQDKLSKALAELPSRDAKESMAFSYTDRGKYLGPMSKILIETFNSRIVSASARSNDLITIGRLLPRISPTIIFVDLGANNEIPCDPESKFLLHPPWQIDSLMRSRYVVINQDETISDIAWLNPIYSLARKLNGYASSYNEGKVFDDWQDSLSINTVFGIMFAAQQGVPVRVLTKSSEVDALHLTNDEKEQLKKSLRTAREIIVPDGEIEIQGNDGDNLAGFVYISHGDEADGYIFNTFNGGGASRSVKSNPSYNYIGSSDFNTTNSSSITRYSTASSDGSASNTYVATASPQEQEDTAGREPSYTGDPVDMFSGEFYQEEEPDISLPSPGVALAVKRIYRSGAIYNSPFGFGWTWNHGEQLLIEANSVTYYNARAIPYYCEKKPDGTYQGPPGATFILSQNAAGSFVITNQDKTRFFFDSTGKLTKKEDSHGNYLQFNYDNSDRLFEIKDRFQQKITFMYSGSGTKVSSVKTSENNFCNYIYDGDDLVRFVDLQNSLKITSQQKFTSYEYLRGQANPLNNHNMTKYTMPGGDSLEIGYYENDQVSFHRNLKGEIFRFQYSRLGGYGETWNEEGYYRKVYFNDQGDEIRVNNEDGTLEEKQYDAHHNLISRTDANGYKTLYDYGTRPEDRLLHRKEETGTGRIWEFQYDDANNPYQPSAVIGPDNKTIAKFSYWPSGKVQAKFEAFGFVRDAADNGLKEDPSNTAGIRTAYFEYDEFGNVVRSDDATGKATTYVYQRDGSGEYPAGLYLLQATDQNGYETRYDYYLPQNEAGMPPGTIKEERVVSQEVQGGEIVTGFEYNQYGQQTAVVDHLGNRTSMEYTPDRKLKRVIAANNATISNVYDTARDIVSGALIKERTDSLGNKEEFRYNGMGKLVWKKDGNGNITTFDYDGLGRVISKTDPLGNTVYFAYDGNGNLVKQGVAMGRDIIFAYDAANRLVKKTDPDGNSVMYEYDDYDRLESETDAEGMITKYYYDALGHPREKIIGFGSDDVRVFGYRYDVLGRLIRETMPKRNFVTHVYDGNGNRVFSAWYDPSGVLLRHVRMAYVPDSRNLLQEEVVDGGWRKNGRGTQYEYDALGRKLATEDANGTRTEYQYDVVGTLVAEINPFGITRHFYDLGGRRVRTVNALGQETSWRYDANGNQVSSRDPQGRETKTYFDAMNRKVGEEDAAGSVTTLDYDANGNLVAVSDPEGNSTRYQYSYTNRLMSETKPLGQTTLYEYYRNGVLRNLRDATGRTISYQYDSLRKPTEVKYFTAGSTQEPARLVEFNYDANGNLAAYADGVTSANYAHDYLDRKIKETVHYGQFSKSFSYGYPDAWTRTFTGTDGEKVSYEYDAGFRLKRIGTREMPLLTNQEFRGDLPLMATRVGGNVTNYAYDHLGRIESITTHNRVRAEIFRERYTYTAGGDLLGKKVGTGIMGQEKAYDYRYDLASRLTEVKADRMVTDTFSYDKVGNRTADQKQPGLWVYNDNNELRSYGSDAALGYDAVGNLAVETHPNVPSKPNTRLADYYYDPFGRRLWKTLEGSRIYYLYADEGLVGEYDQDGYEVKLYGYDFGSDWGTNPVYMKQDGQYYFYLNDHLGTPKKMIDSGGKVVWEAEYDAFGKAEVKKEKEKGFNNLRFPGQYYDVESDYHYNWYRYYDPATGRYLQADPLGLEAGINLYVYVQNNPGMLIDPWGLTWKSPSIDQLTINNSYYNQQKIGKGCYPRWATEPVGGQSADDINLGGRVVNAEATIDLEDTYAAASTLYNRIDADKISGGRRNTITGVVSAPNQYESYQKQTKPFVNSDPRNVVKLGPANCNKLNQSIDVVRDVFESGPRYEYEDLLKYNPEKSIPNGWERRGGNIYRDNPKIRKNR